MENKRIANIANARRNNQDEYEESVHETAYWKRRESIEKKPYNCSDSASMKLKKSKEKKQGDTVEVDKEERRIPKKQEMTTQTGVKDSKEKSQGDTVEFDKEEMSIPKKQAMTRQMRVEEGKTRDKDRRKARVMTKDRWLVRMPETIIEGQDEED